MTTKTLGILLLLLAPAGLVYVAGHAEAAHYVGLGSVLALQLGVLARPVAAFAILIPVVYGAAAVTGQATDGVVALIVAAAAAVGASGSRGLHRGLVALLAAALLGSFETAGTGEVGARMGYLLAGSTYGFLLSVTVLRRASLEAPRLHPQLALGYAVVLATLALVAWFAARLSGLEHAWWLPLVAVIVSEPLQPGPAHRSLVRIALGATAAMALILLSSGVDVPALRVLLLAAALFLVLSAASRQPVLSAMLVAPTLVLMSTHSAVHGTFLDVLRLALPAFLPVVAMSALAHWLLWTLRRGSSRVAA